MYCVSRLDGGDDYLQRLSGKTVASDLTESYLYQAGASGTNQTSMLVSEKIISLGGTANSCFYYTYDSNGNISSAEEGLSGETVVYTYDNQNQLLKAEHRDGRTETYTYDTVGNLLTFNNGTTSHTYTYGDSEWKDLLTALDGVTLTYDGMGNPLSYYNGTSYTMSWIEGRKLSSVTVGSGTDAETTVTYQYNADGQRIRKNYSDGSYTQYLIADGRVLAERRYDSSGSVIIQLRYNYDENGTVCGYSTTVGGYPWTDYYFIRNLQGDVVQVFRDSDNAIVATYSYDSWGNILTATGEQAEVNPFRYRGYYYDEETGFYYLGTRYYDPSIGRFINSDEPGLLGVNGDFTGLNLFTYCGNNPISRKDIGGYFWDTVFDIASLAVSIADVVSNPTDPWAWAGVVGDALDLIPVVTGLGETVKAIRAAKTIDNVVDVADDIHDMGKITDIAQVATKGTSNEIGKIGEQLAGIDPSAKVPIQINGRTRVPDALTDTTLTEVKNVKYISNTQQLKDFADYANATGRTLELYVRPTTNVAKTVTKAGWNIKYIW